MLLQDHILPLLKQFNEAGALLKDKFGHIDVTAINNPASHDHFITVLFFFALTIEIVIVLITALLDSGAKAFGRGVQAFIWATIMAGLINSGLLGDILISFINEATMQVTGGKDMITSVSQSYDRAFAAMFPTLDALAHVSTGQAMLNNPISNAVSNSGLGVAIYDLLH